MRIFLQINKCVMALDRNQTFVSVQHLKIEVLKLTTICIHFEKDKSLIEIVLHQFEHLKQSYWP